MDYESEKQSYIYGLAQKNGWYLPRNCEAWQRLANEGPKELCEEAVACMYLLGRRAEVWRLNGLIGVLELVKNKTNFSNLPATESAFKHLENIYVDDDLSDDDDPDTEFSMPSAARRSVAAALDELAKFIHEPKSLDEVYCEHLIEKRAEHLNEIAQIKKKLKAIDSHLGKNGKNAAAADEPAKKKLKVAPPK